MSRRGVLTGPWLYSSTSAHKHHKYIYEFIHLHSPYLARCHSCSCNPYRHSPSFNMRPLIPVSGLARTANTNGKLCWYTSNKSFSCAHTPWLFMTRDFCRGSGSPTQTKQLPSYWETWVLCLRWGATTSILRTTAAGEKATPSAVHDLSCVLLISVWLVDYGTSKQVRFRIGWRLLRRNGIHRNETRKKFEVRREKYWRHFSMIYIAERPQLPRALIGGACLVAPRPVTQKLNKRTTNSVLLHMWNWTWDVLLTSFGVDAVSCPHCEFTTHNEYDSIRVWPFVQNRRLTAYQCKL